MEDQKIQPLAGELQNEQRCRICGCTQDNCQQCIDKTGSPCHWVEVDLCSACMPEPEEKIPTQVPDPVREYNDKILKQKSNINDMNFFKQLNELVPGVSLSIALKEKNGKYTLSLVPMVDSKTIFQPLLATGTPEELDEKFFDNIKKPLLETAAALKNADAFKESVDKTTKEKPSPAPSKPAEKKKKPVPAKEKKEVKKVEPKIAEPDLFPAT